MPNIPTIAVKESRADLLEIGPSTGLSGFRLVYVIGKGLYRWRTGDQSSNVPGSNDSDAWVAPSEDTSGKFGAWNLEEPALLDPEHATDSGTDTFVSATNTGTPGDGVVITRDFQSANTTPTPTLDGKTISVRDFAGGVTTALWAGCIDGVHSLKYNSGSDQYTLLDPHPIDEDNMSSDSSVAVPTQQSVKAYADGKSQESAGSYTGDGTTSQSITGIGFQPSSVRIWVRETATGTDQDIHETTSVIIDDHVDGMAIQIAESSGTPFIRTITGRIVSLDSDGFTVGGGANNPNIDGQVYNYLARG